MNFVYCVSFWIGFYAINKNAPFSIVNSWEKNVFIFKTWNKKSLFSLHKECSLSSFAHLVRSYLAKRCWLILQSVEIDVNMELRLWLSLWPSTCVAETILILLAVITIRWNNNCEFSTVLRVNIVVYTLQCVYMRICQTWMCQRMTVCHLTVQRWHKTKYIWRHYDSFS